MKLYIDPGTGSMLFSLAIGLLSVLWYSIRKLYLKVIVNEFKSCVIPTECYAK